MLFIKIMKKNDNIILASLDVLPKLMFGKVVIIFADKHISLNPAKYVKIEDDFNPLDYSILIHPNYNKCIVYSNEYERREFLIKQEIDKRFLDKKVVKVVEPVIKTRKHFISFAEFKDAFIQGAPVYIRSKGWSPLHPWKRITTWNDDHVICKKKGNSSRYDLCNITEMYIEY